LPLTTLASRGESHDRGRTATAHAPPLRRPPKPRPDGCSELRFTPLQLIERLAALIPPPRVHRHRYHGVLAPNSPHRAQVTALAREPPPSSTPPTPADAPQRPQRSPARILWALLLARILRSSRCNAATVAARYASLPSSPMRPRFTRSSITWANPPAHPKAHRCGTRRPSRCTTGRTARRPCPSHAPAQSPS
jgi:hypothetical protein